MFPDGDVAPATQCASSKLDAYVVGEVVAVDLGSPAVMFPEDGDVAPATQCASSELDAYVLSEFVAVRALGDGGMR